MARIEDFGDHLSGAAKERWRGFRDAFARARREAGDPLTSPLSEAFPEPPYERLLSDGVDPWLLAFVRAVREQVPARPVAPHRVRAWAGTVRALRDLAGDLISGEVSTETLRRRLGTPAHDQIRTDLDGRIALYIAMGHARSLRGYRLTEADYTLRDGVRFDPPQRRWDVVRDRSGRRSEVIVSDPARDGAIAAFRDRLETGTGRAPPRRAPIRIYSYRDRPERGVVIGVKNGPHLIELARFRTATEAQTHLCENRDLLEARLAQLRDLPAERGTENRDRTGPALRTGDVSPELFLERFGLRGVQFGNYVEGARRQSDLNRAHDALMDLASVLGCAPHALSLNGTLGLAFGARGRGGKGAAAAHFEPVEIVINLTRTNGAGALAHEWFHALDNHLARAAGARSSSYASGAGGEANAPMGALVRRLSEGTGMMRRSDRLDRVRSEPYFSTPVELVARGFEAFVISALSERGAVNDYLANVTPEEVFEAEAALRGQPPGGYPYPRAGEMGEVRAAYKALLGAPGLRHVLAPAGPDMRDQVPDGTVTRPADQGPVSRPETGPGPRTSPTPDFDW